VRDLSTFGNSALRGFQGNLRLDGIRSFGELKGLSIPLPFEGILIFQALRVCIVLRTTFIYGDEKTGRILGRFAAISILPGVSDYRDYNAIVILMVSLALGPSVVANAHSIFQASRICWICIKMLLHSFLN